jgi:hypothetical protein
MEMKSLGLLFVLTTASAYPFGIRVQGHLQEITKKKLNKFTDLATL